MLTTSAAIRPVPRLRSGPPEPAVEQAAEDAADRDGQQRGGDEVEPEPALKK
jgi:hypothetical protein